MRVLLLLLGVGLAWAKKEEEHYLDVKEIVKDAIQTMAKIPNTVANETVARVNATEREEMKPYLPWLQLPADIINRIAVDAGIIDEPTTTTPKPWIISRRRKGDDDDDDDDVSGFKQDSYEEERRERRRRIKKKLRDEEQYIKISDLLKLPSAASLTAAPSTPAAASPMPLATTAPLVQAPAPSPAPAPMVQALPQASPPVVPQAAIGSQPLGVQLQNIQPAAGSPQVLLRPVKQPDGSTYYELVNPHVLSSQMPQGVFASPFAANPAFTVPVVQQQSPLMLPSPVASLLNTSPPQTPVVNVKAMSTVAPMVVQSSSDSFAAPTFPPPVKILPTVSGETRNTLYPARFAKTSSDSTRSPMQMPMDDMPVKRQYGAKTMEATREMGGESSTVKTVEVYKEESGRYGRRLQLKASPLKIHSIEDRHLKEVVSTETEDIREIKRAEDLRNAEDREHETEEEEDYTPPPVKRRKMKMNKPRKIRKRVEIPLDDEKTSEEETVEPPRATPATPQFEHAMRSLPSDSDEASSDSGKMQSMESPKRKRVRAYSSKTRTFDKDQEEEDESKPERTETAEVMDEPASSAEPTTTTEAATTKRRRMRHRSYLPSTYEDPEHIPRRSKRRRTTTTTTTEAPTTTTTTEEPAEDYSYDQSMSAEDVLTTTAMATTRRHRRLRKPKAKKISDEASKENDSSDVKEAPKETSKPAKSEKSERTVISLSKPKRLRRKMKKVTTTTTEAPPPLAVRQHCLNIRSFAKQFGIYDVEEFTIEHCAFIENYYPELTCDRREEYYDQCKQYYN